VMVLLRTLTLCPGRLAFHRIGSDQEWSSPNVNRWCLQGRGAEETIRLNYCCDFTSILGHAYPLFLLAIFWKIFFISIINIVATCLIIFNNISIIIFAAASLFYYIIFYNIFIIILAATHLYTSMLGKNCATHSAADLRSV